MHGFGLGQESTASSTRAAETLRENRPGLVAAQQLRVRHGVQPDAAVGAFGIGEGGADKGQGQAGDEQVLHPVGEQGGGTDDDIVARRQRPGQVGEHGVGQPIGVSQLIDPLTQGVYRLKLAQHPFHVAAQEALHRPAGLAVPLLDLPGENAPGPFGHFGLQRRGEQQGAETLPDLGRRRQTAVGPLIAGLVALHTAHQLLAQGLEPRPVVAVAQIDVTLHQPRIFWLHDVGESSTRTVLQGVTPWGCACKFKTSR